MVLMCRRLLPEADGRTIYMQGADSFKLPKGHFTVSVYCSPHNPGAQELAEELNDMWPGLLQVADVPSCADLKVCDHMLVYLNGQTWTHNPELLAADIREAMRVGLHLQPCHEYPSVTAPSSVRHALDFKQIMDATPADLKKRPTNVYSQIAIALKGGELREPGLAILAGRLAVRVARKPFEAPLPHTQEVSTSPEGVAGMVKSMSRYLVVWLFRSVSQDKVADRFKSTSKSDAAVGADPPSSFTDDVPTPRRTPRSTVVVNDTPASSATGVLTIESPV